MHIARAYSSLPSARIRLGLCDNTEVGDEGYARESLAAEAVRVERAQVVKLCQFRSREALCEDGQVFALRSGAQRRNAYARGARTRMPEPLSRSWRSLSPPSLTMSCIEVEPASSAFSSSSLSADEGLWIICGGIESLVGCLRVVHAPLQPRYGLRARRRVCGWV